MRRPTGTRPAADGGGAPSITDIVTLTRRLRTLSNAGPAERAAFLADKAALLARITDQAEPEADPQTTSRLPP